MSKGKWRTENDPYIQEIIRLRQKGYSWKALGRYFKKDHTTIIYHWKRYKKESVKTKILSEVGGKVRLQVKTFDGKTKQGFLNPSWDKEKHLCCNSFLPEYHFPDCPNVAGTWKAEELTYDYMNQPIPKYGKYDNKFDERVNVGKSYKQYRIEGH